MKTRITILTLILFSFLIPLCSGLEVIINSPFNYADDYVNHGWSYTCGGFACVDFTPYPLPSPFGTNALAYNNKNTHATVYSSDIHLEYGSFTSGVIDFSFDVNIQNNSVNLNNPFTASFQINGSSSTGRLFFAIQPYLTNLNLTVYSPLKGETNLCSKIISTDSQNFTSNLRLVIDVDNNVYSTYSNNTLLCDNIQLLKVGSQLFNMTEYQFEITVDASENLQIYVDNMLMVITGDNSSISLSSTGDPCTTNEDCSSGKCEYGACVLKQVGQQCTSSSQCASNDCKNGLCTKASLSQNINNSKDELFGSDSMTANIISLLIMIGVALAIIIGGKGSNVAVLGGLFVFVALAFTLTLMGWLSAFILLGVIICLLVAIVLMFVMGITN